MKIHVYQKSRIRENRMYGSVRGNRQSLNDINILKGESRLSTRRIKMKRRKFSQDFKEKLIKEALETGNASMA